MRNMRNNIKIIILKRNITQVNLAEKVGIKREYLNRIINRKITPSVSLGIRIARALDLPVEDVFII